MTPNGYFVSGHLISKENTENTHSSSQESISMMLWDIHLTTIDERENIQQF